ncbi:TPA: hypothetical protein DCX16_01435, partial [bacterium]|nr:hypothetical protein [bacterium]
MGVLAVSEKTGKSYPREEDYFICPPEVQAIYGEKSKRIDIMFPSDNPEVIMPYCYKLYGDNNRLKCKGNGEEAVYYDFQERKWKEKTCPCELLDKGCSIRGHLMVILPRVSLGGVYQIDTGSGANINRVLDAIRYWKMTVGRVKGLLLTLERIPEKIANPDGKMIIHYLFKFGCDLSAQTLNMAIEDTKRIMAIDYQVESPKEDGELSDTPIVYVDEENGENKINNIETESEILEEESEILEEELEILEETEQNDTDGLTKFQKFLIAMDEIKKELKQKFGDEAGEKIYYKELKTRGFEHANQIKIRDEQVAVYT